MDSLVGKFVLLQIEDVEKSNRDIASRIREIQMHRRNKVLMIILLIYVYYVTSNFFYDLSFLSLKVTAFGGVRVTNLLQAIERNQHKFSIPPIGPIGAHVVYY